MKTIQIIVLIFILNNCTTQKGACEEDALAIDHGYSYGGCEDLPIFVFLKSVRTNEEGRSELQKYIDFQLLRCLRYTQAKGAAPTTILGMWFGDGDVFEVNNNDNVKKFVS